MVRFSPQKVEEILSYRTEHTYAETLGHFGLSTRSFARAVDYAVATCYVPPSGARLSYPFSLDTLQLREDAPESLASLVLTSSRYVAYFQMPLDFVQQHYLARRLGADALPEGIYRNPDNVAELLLCALEEDTPDFRQKSREERIDILCDTFITRDVSPRSFLLTHSLDDLRLYVPEGYNKSGVGLLLWMDRYLSAQRDEPRMFDTTQKKHLRWWEISEQWRFEGVLGEGKKELIYNILETVFCLDVPGYKEAYSLSSPLEGRAAQIAVLQKDMIDGAYREDTVSFFKAHNIRFLLDKLTLGRTGSTRAVLDVWDTVHSDLYQVPSYFSSTHADQEISALRMRTAKGIGRRKIFVQGEDAAK